MQHNKQITSDSSITDTVSHADVGADCYCHQNKIVDKDVRPKGTSKFVNEDFQCAPVSII